LAEKDRELRERLQTSIIDGELAPVPLVFNKNTRIVHWDGGSVKLGTKPFKILKVLYFVPKRRTKISSLSKRVWGISSKHHSTVKSTVSRLNTKLKKAQCPYRISSAKCLQPVIYNRDPVSNKVKDSTEQPIITGFKLVIRK
jgi:DNA-binding response OmpR family regulator